MFDLHFLRPHYLMSLAVILPALLGMLYFGFILRKRARAAYGEEKLIQLTSKPIWLMGEVIHAAAWVCAITLLVVAAAGPLSRSLPTNVKAGTLQVIAVVDVSKSMGAEDYRAVMPPKDGYSPDMVPGPYGSRLDYVKYVLAGQVMPAIIGNQLGIVTYSGNGFEQVPLTDDWTSVKWVMRNWMVIGNAPGGGSDYAEGLSMADQMFRRDQIAGRQKVVLLFTDGGFTGDQKDLATALGKLRDDGVKVIIVGVGSLAPAPIPEYSPNGQLTGYFKKDGKVVMTQVDEGALQALAVQSGGQYMLLDPNGTSKIDVAWASTLGGSKAETKEDPVFQYPLTASLMLMLGLFLRGAFRRRNARS